MKKQHCRECQRETWHNPGKKPDKAGVERTYRCVECGHPRRAGMAWNRGIRLRGRIDWLAPGQAA